MDQQRTDSEIDGQLRRYINGRIYVIVRFASAVAQKTAGIIDILHFVHFQTLGLCIVTGTRLSADFPEKAPRETVPKMPVFAF